MAFPTIYHHNHNTLGGGARTKLAVFLCANKYPPPPSRASQASPPTIKVCLGTAYHADGSVSKHHNRGAAELRLRSSGISEQQLAMTGSSARVA